MSAPGGGRFQRLDPAMLLATLDKLHERIVARFPDRNLGRVASEVRDVLVRIVDEAEERWRRERTVRTLSLAGVVVVVGLAVTALALSVRDAVEAADETLAFQWLPVIESAVNDVVFAGLAVWFLVSLPLRMRRRRALAALHRLRSLAHVIDMHQLTKDPERLRPGFPTTDESPPADLTLDELERYLDYCTELLSLVGKGAALCAQASDDAVVLDTVSEIETLTLGMSRKIWQKISLVRAAR